MAASYGLAPDPWQAMLVLAWLGRGEDRLLTAGRCGLAVPRQNGKNAVVEMVELFKVTVQGRKILHTAHEMKTARRSFLRLIGFFTNAKAYPELAEQVQSIRMTNGQEAIYLHNGGSVEFIARSRGSGRGFTVDDLIFDEAQELADEHLEALLPTISAAPSGDPQIVMTGTPPPPNADGGPWRKMRAAGVAGKDPRLSWHEWSPKVHPPEGDIEAVMTMVRETNPALGIRLSEAVVRDELAAMSFRGFLRERGGSWEADQQGGAIDAGAWDRLRIDPGAVPDTGRKVYAVKFSADGDRVGTAVAQGQPNGPTHVEALGIAPTVAGTSALVDWLAARWNSAARIVVDGRAGTGDLVAALVEAGVPRRRIRIVTVEEAITAHASMARSIEEGTLTHIGQPGLDAQVRCAGRRKIGTAGGWGWQPVTPGGDTTALDAVTLARWEAESVRSQVRGTGRQARGRQAVVM